jgi:hypothetical protein
MEPKAASRILHNKIEPGEASIAEGRVEEVSAEDEQSLDYVVVTDRRVLINHSFGDDVASLPFDKVTSFSEATHGHRWYIHLRHQPISRYRHKSWWQRTREFGPDAYETRPESATFLRFSRRDTAAAQALRDQLEARGIPRLQWDARSPTVYPRHRRTIAWFRVEE